MICPKCGYKRKAKETVPDGQCPSCGVFYSKVPNEMLPRATITYQEPKPFPYGKVVMAAAVLAAGAWLAPYLRTIPGGPLSSTAELYAPDGRTRVRDLDMREVRITMYSLTTCVYCRELRRVFEANSIPFREVFIDTDQARMEELIARLKQAGITGGAIGTPTLDVNGRMMPNNPPLAEILREVAAYAVKKG
jgi:glutaredoxin